MVLCHETCPFGLVWKGFQEPRCGGCGAGAAACRCHDSSMLRFTSPTLRITRADLMGWKAAGVRVLDRVQTPSREGAGPRWFAVPGPGVAA